MTDAEKYGYLMTTVSSRDDASAITDCLIEGRLAACVQIVSMQSHYMWKGERVAEPELLLLIKTRVALFDQAMQAIAAIHPYETPEIVTGNFTGGFAGYFSWIDDVTK